MARRLYVGNLSYDCSEAELRELFSQAGVCESARIITDRSTGRSRGFAFVEMGSEEDARRAIELLNGTEVRGRSLTVSAAREQKLHPVPGRSGSGRRPAPRRR